MKRSIIPSVLIAAALLLSAGSSFAVEQKTASGAETNAVSKAKARDHKTVKAKKAKAAKAKLVDINSAGKAELKKLPGIKDAAADKIVAGRPYLSKADLVTQNIISMLEYEALKSRIIALPNKASAAKLERLKKERANR